MIGTPARDVPALTIAVEHLTAKRLALSERLLDLLRTLDPVTPWECHPLRRGVILDLAHRVELVEREETAAVDDLRRTRALGTGAHDEDAPLLEVPLRGAVRP